MRLIGLDISEGINRLIKERFNNKYLKVYLIKPHLCVKTFDKPSPLFFTIVILTHCDDVTVTLFIHTMIFVRHHRVCYCLCLRAKQFYLIAPG